MLPRFGSALRALILALFAASLLVSLGQAAKRSRVRFVLAASHLGEDSRQARRRVLGARWLAAEEEIARAIPAGGEYLLVDGGEERQGATLFLRYQLAPRRARFVGRLSEVGGPARWAASLPAGARWVVVAYPGRPPVLVGRADFPRWLEGTLGRR
ncbi:MAG TPA: hypothetical protein VGQ28_03590 [Thermoanaerobaculia bacterium]|nr:hypothetical protein [Thermoanaerobaculia bacterium]